MGILTPFTSPHDIRWHGAQRYNHIFFFFKNIVLLLFIVLVIVEYALFKKWWESGPYSYHRDWTWAP
jgi:hypothetical protein